MSLVDSAGRPISTQPVALRDPVFDSRVEQGGYALPNVRQDHMTPELRADLSNEIAVARARMDAAGQHQREINLDAFVNELTALGTTWGDKTRGGLPGGPDFFLYRMTGPQAEARARGSDLGANIVNKIPDEMTREGWSLEIQPDEGEDFNQAEKLDACIRAPWRAAAAWRAEAQANRMDAFRCYLNARRWDEFPAGPAAPAPPPPPGPLPKLNDEGIEIARAMEEWGDLVGVERAVNQALRYERTYGGGAVLIGVDDGVDDLTQPLDRSRVNRVTHLTPLTGGWDGECVMWRPFNDPREPKFGQPEIYQVRNLSVQLARPPAPGESRPVQQLIPRGPSGPTIFYVHASRLLIFDGEPVSRQVQQEMRGWGDSVFTRVNEVLAQYEQTWNAVAALMQEFSIVNMGIEGYSALLASKKAEDREIIMRRARELQQTRSVLRMNVYDAKDKVERMNVSIAGIPELLDGAMARRLAAAADMPVSLLFGQVKGALGGDAGDTETRYFYDRVRAWQNRKLAPQLRRLYEIVFKSKDGPTGGTLPARWSIVMRPLWQPTPSEQADVRAKTVTADSAEIASGVVTPEEVAATRYGGAEYNPGPIVLDIEGRQQMAAREAMRVQQQQRAQQVPAPQPGAGPANGNNAAAPKEAVTQGVIPEQPPMTAMPADPLTGDPTATPSTIGSTSNMPEQK